MFGRLIKGRNLTTTVLALLLALAGSAQARVYIVTDTNDSTQIEQPVFVRDDGLPRSGRDPVES